MMTEKKHYNVALFVPHAGCPHQCVFCNQRHIAGTAKIPSALDVQTACQTAKRTLPPDTEAQIAFFGGSFTAIPRRDMEALLKAAAPFVKNGDFVGIRVSTRPDAVDEEILQVLKNHGVTTVELGAQSMNDTVLARCGRGHTAEQIKKAAALIKKAGLSLGLQMMTGLPDSTDEIDEQTAHELAALHPDEVRVYPTLVIDGTPLGIEYRQGKYVPQSLEQAVALCARLLVFFEEERHIPVIRMGLHAEGEMVGHLLAGPFHPAFRELCESRIYRDKALALLQEKDELSAILRVHPTALSKMVGHKKENIRAFATAGFAVTIAADENVLPGQIIWGK